MKTRSISPTASSYVYLRAFVATWLERLAGWGLKRRRPSMQKIRAIPKHCQTLLSLGLLSLLAVSVAQASITGSISGTVTDPSGAAIPGASVVAHNTETGIRTSTETNVAGFYSLPTLPAGHYEVIITKSGFEEYRQTGLVLDVNTALRVDAPLKVGAVTQKVTVSGAGLHVDAESSQVGEVITSQIITAVPLNGRSFTDLLALQPGVVPQSSGFSSYGLVGAPSGDLDPGSLSVNGERESSNGFMVNGADVVEEVQRGTAVIPNLDSIAEWRIMTSNFAAEYGNFSGGQVNVATKSGTNSFHGGAFEFLRNTSLDSRNFFSYNQVSPTGAQIPGSAIGRFQQNQFGGTFGGPLIRNKAFFFADYQGTRMIQGVDSGLIPVPTVAERNGNFSALAGSLTGTVGGSGWAGVLSSELGYPVHSGESYYISGCATSTQCVFPNAVIPQQALASPVSHLMPYIPLPNYGDDFFTTSANNQTLGDDKGAIRIDANTRWGSLMVYYFIDNSSLNVPYPYASVPGFNGVDLGRAQLLNLGDTKSFGASSVNEFHLNYMRNVSVLDQPVGGAGVSPGSLGFVQGCNTLGICPVNPNRLFFPDVLFLNYTLGDYGPIPFYENTYQAIDKFSKVMGTHTVALGGETHFDQVNEFIAVDYDGGFIFTGEETGVDFADFLIGAPASYFQGVQEPAYGRSRYVGLFGQDSWRATSDLTLTYGLRWDLTTPWAEKHNEQETIVPGEQSVVFPGSPTGWVFPGDPGIPSTISSIRYDNLAPRFGVAYAPNPSGGFWKRLFGGAGKSSIRAGFGKFFDQMGDFETTQEIGDAPFGDFYSTSVPPGFAEPFINRGTQTSAGQRFPVTLPPLNVSAAHPDPNVNWAGFIPIAGSPGWFPGNKSPYSVQYNVSFQRQFGGNDLLSLSYVGSQGHHLLVNLEANPGNPALCLSVSQPSEVMPGTPTCGPYGENGVYSPVTGGVINSTRTPLGANFGSVGWADTMGNSSYNSFQASWHHTSGRLQFLASYTYSKCLDQSSDISEQVNPFNYALSRGLCAYDTTQDFVTSYSYNVPFDEFFHHANRLTRGWSVAGITSFVTGLPVTILDSSDQCLIGDAATGSSGSSTCEPNFTPGPILENTNPRSGQPYFNTSLFTAPSLGQLGTSGRRFFTGPGINDWDMTLLKDTALTENKTLQFRAEFFNAFNHAQFGGPNGLFNSGIFGLVTSARSPRIMQFALKLRF